MVRSEVCNQSNILHVAGVVRCDLQLIYMSFITCSVVWFCIIVLAVIEIWKKAKPSLQMCQRPGPAAPIESFEVSGAPEVAPPFDIEVAIAKDRPSLVCAPWKGPPLKGGGRQFRSVAAW